MIPPKAIVIQGNSMPSIEILVAFTAAALLMNLSPGPSNFYVMARSIGQGTRSGVVAALGLALGSVVHVVATTFGIAAIFEYSPLAYTALKLVGAGYLIYLGYCYVTAGSAAAAPDAQLRHKPQSAILRESMLVEITNPKTALFFLALLPQFVVPEAGPVAPQLLLLGLIVTVSAIPCDVVVALAAGRAAGWFARNQRAQIIQQRISGGILLGLGGYILFEEARG
jgi:threonine/homoserine/homoserine lactone efflux protein